VASAFSLMQPQKSEKTVTILFARKDSIYKTLTGVDVYDIERDALKYNGGNPIVAHPPCRTWGRYSHWATRAEPGEHELAPWTVDKIRKNGGVLEHPCASKLWYDYDLPKPGWKDKFGGWTLQVYQWWWGHPCEKNTWLYICGVNSKCIPGLPFKLGHPDYVIGYSRKNSYGKIELSKSKRDVTPILFAKWLVDLARKV